MPIYRRTLAFFKPFRAQTIAVTLLTVLSKQDVYAALHRAANLSAR